MERFNALFAVLLLFTVSTFFLQCGTDVTNLKVRESVPQSKLADYNDSFDTFRSALWDKAGYIYNEAQEANFRLAKSRDRSEARANLGGE